jgi:hypothetical protein
MSIYWSANILTQINLIEITVFPDKLLVDQLLNHFPKLLRKVNVQKLPPPHIPRVSQIIPIRTLQIYVFKSHFSIITLIMFRSSAYLTKFLSVFLTSPYTLEATLVLPLLLF